MHTIAFLLLFGLLACSDKSTAPDSDREPATVALQIDAEEKKPNFLQRICQELMHRDIPATLFINPDMASAYDHVIKKFYLSGFEIAMLSPYLGDASRSVQSYRLVTSSARLAGCVPCGTSHPINGFRPAGFTQNEDTYQLADSLGFIYDAGFQAHVLYAPGHEQDDGPYRIEGYDLIAVPVSTVLWQRARVCLSDLDLRDLGVEPEAWDDWLIAAMDEAGKGSHPLVAVVHDAITGAEESPFWSPFVRFLDRAQEQGARFITTERLVMEYGIE